MHVVAITLALLTQLPKADPKPIPWLADGEYAPESAVYELQCVTSQEELCQILAVMEWSVLMDAKRGVLRHFFDAEFGHVLLLPDTVTSAAAEGGLAREEIEDRAELMDGARFLARMQRRFVLWRDGEDLIVRWSGPSDGMTRPGPVKFERFVPRARLNTAAEARAAEIGATVAACMEMGRMAPPLFEACRLGPGKMGADKAGAGKAAAPSAPKRATAK